MNATDITLPRWGAIMLPENRNLGNYMAELLLPHPKSAAGKLDWQGMNWMERGSAAIPMLYHWPPRKAFPENCISLLPAMAWHDMSVRPAGFSTLGGYQAWEPTLNGRPCSIHLEVRIPQPQALPGWMMQWWGEKASVLEGSQELNQKVESIEFPDGPTILPLAVWKAELFLSGCLH